jgi:hypothetical protein
MLAVVAAFAVAAGATPATAATGHNGASVRVFASGFPFDDRGIGPVGLAFDDQRRLYVTDRHLYRFGPPGGDASAAQLTGTPLGTIATGLAFAADGRLYAGRFTGDQVGEIVELDPSSGAVVRRVAAGLPCPTALAIDPLTSDLFVSTVSCGRQVLRISAPAGSSPTVSPFVTGLSVDGMMFAPDGTLFIAHDPDRDGRTVSIVSPSGVRTGISSVAHPDGLALGRPQRKGDPPPFLVVNRIDGVITKIDLQAPGAEQVTLMDGGSRGDLAAVGDDGCLYATQTDRVLKLTNADGTCTRGRGEGDAPALGQGLLPSRSSVLDANARSKTCSPRKRIKVRVGFPEGRLRVARVYLGARRVRTVRGKRRHRPVTLRFLPARSFRVTVRATLRSGRRVARQTRYSACGRKVLSRKRVRVK